MPLLFGGVAHLARALAWHARGSRFKSDHLHSKTTALKNAVFFCKIGKMKKTSVLAFLVSALFLSSAFAKIETLPIDQRPKQYIQLGYGRTVDRGINRNKNYGFAQYNFEWQPFGGFAGFQSDSKIFDLTLRTTYLPFAGYHQNGVWRFGASTAYHMQRSLDSYREHDILWEIEARWISTSGLTFVGRTGYSLRVTTFDAIKNFCMTDGDIVAYAEVDKVWKNGMELFTSLGSYNLYRYPLFFCPQWTFGAAYNIKEVVRVGASLEVGMTDFYASVAYFNHIMAKVDVRICF